MNALEKAHLLFQQAHLQDTLANLSSDDYIMRVSTESRLRSIALRLAACVEELQLPADEPYQ